MYAVLLVKQNRSRISYRVFNGNIQLKDGMPVLLTLEGGEAHLTKEDYHTMLDALRPVKSFGDAKPEVEIVAPIGTLLEE